VIEAGGTTISIEVATGAERDVEGIGVVLDQKDDHVEVIAVRKGPAAGQVPVGASITAVDGTPIAGIHAALARIRGPVGTEVTLTLAHEGRTWEVTLVRARVPINSARSTAA
jgi:carboxyl-terminal processing protease